MISVKFFLIGFIFFTKPSSILSWSNTTSNYLPLQASPSDFNIKEDDWVQILGSVVISWRERWIIKILQLSSQSPALFTRIKSTHNSLSSYFQNAPKIFTFPCSLLLKTASVLNFMLDESYEQNLHKALTQQAGLPLFQTWGSSERIYRGISGKIYWGSPERIYGS